MMVQLSWVVDRIRIQDYEVQVLVLQYSEYYEY